MRIEDAQREIAAAAFVCGRAAMERACRAFDTPDLMA